MNFLILSLLLTVINIQLWGDRNSFTFNKILGPPASLSQTGWGWQGPLGLCGPTPAGTQAKIPTEGFSGLDLGRFWRSSRRRVYRLSGQPTNTHCLMLKVNSLVWFLSLPSNSIFMYFNDQMPSRHISTRHSRRKTKLL